MQLLKCKRSMSSAMRPQSDGQTERVNRIIEELLRHYCNFELNDWDKLLPCVEFAYNSAFHSSTKETPFRVDIGRQPHSPQIWNGMQITNLSNESADALALRLAVIGSRITQNLRLAQENQKKYYDKMHTDVSFNVGDKVLLKRAHINLAAFAEIKKKKLLQAYVGPFEIVERIGKLAYRLKLPRGSKCHDVFHVSALRLYNAATDGRNPSPPDPIVTENDEVEYKVERIVDSRIRNRRTEYLVLWEGYPSSEATWEPLANVNGSQALVDFRSRNVS